MQHGSRSDWMYNMKTTSLLLLVGSCVNLVASQGSLQLPAGAELLLGPIKTSFECPMSYGYYADADNDCRVFHVCNPVQKGDRVRMEKYSFICGNLTVFDQLSQTCTFADNAIPCGNAAEFFYLNERIGVEKAFFHEDDDIKRAAKLVPLYGRYADSPTANGRPGGKPLGFKGKAFFTNRDRKPAQSVREDLNVTRINKAKNNRLYVPLEGGLLNVHKNPQALSPLAKKLPIGMAGRRRSSTPSFGTLPGYGNRLNLDVINFRDNDFKVRRLQLTAGQKAQLASRPADVKFVTSQERQAEESALRQPEIDDGHSQTTESGKGRASVPHDSGRSDDKPSVAERVPPISTTTPATPSESATPKANIETIRTADDTKTEAGPVTEKPDVNEMPNSAGIIKSSNEEKPKPESESTKSASTTRAPAKSTAPKKSPSKSPIEVKKGSKKVGSGSRQDEKMKKTVSTKADAAGTAGKQNSKSTATAPAKSMASATTTAAPSTSRKPKKVRSTAAPAEGTEAPTALTEAQPTSTTPPTNKSTASKGARTPTAEPMSATTSQPSTTTPTTDTPASQPTMQVSSTESEVTEEASTTEGTSTTPRTTPKPVQKASRASEAPKTKSTGSKKTPTSQSTDSPTIVVTIPPLPAVSSSTVTDSEVVRA